MEIYRWNMHEVSYLWITYNFIVCITSNTVQRINNIKFTKRVLKWFCSRNRYGSWDHKALRIGVTCRLDGGNKCNVINRFPTNQNYVLYSLAVIHKKVCPIGLYFTFLCNLSGPPNPLHGAGNFSNTCCACDEHEIQFRDWRVDMYMHNYKCNLIGLFYT